MSLFHHARNVVNRLLAPTGFAVNRTNKTPWNWLKSTATTRIGRYLITVPTKNPVAWQYSHKPGLISQLGRLTSVVRKKYPSLAVIDVGANVGDTACIIKSAENIPLLCIEGDGVAFGFLQKNIAQFEHTTAHQLFLGEKTETISADIEKSGWNLTLKPGTTVSARTVKLNSLDDFLATQPNQVAFKLLKIDTEGFDCSIIRGAMNYVRNVFPVITFEYNRGNMDAIGELGLPTLSMLQAAGYSRVVFHDQEGRFLLTTTLADNLLVKDLHDYADCVEGRIGYLDITVFHSKDADLAEAFVESERSRRSSPRQ
jgi:FkbM family methyltransferase